MVIYGRTTRGRCSVMSSGDVAWAIEVAGNVYTLASGVYSDNGDPVTFLAGASSGREQGRTLQQHRGSRRTRRQAGDRAGVRTYARTAAFRMTRAGRGPIGWPLLGPWGNTRPRRMANAWALVREPGRVLEIRTTDPVLATLTGLLDEPRAAYG